MVAKHNHRQGITGEITQYADLFELSGADWFLLQATGGVLRYTLDGETVPSSTVGLRLIPGQKPIAVPADVMRNIQMVRETPQVYAASELGSYSGASKWWDTVKANNGILYGIPYHKLEVGRLDPADDSLSLLGSISGNSKFIGGTLASTGNIYGTPFSATKVLKIIPSTDTVSELTTTYAGASKWRHGVEAANGKIYCAPYNKATVLTINTSSDATAEIGSLSASAAMSLYGVLGSNGKVYFIPYGSEFVIKVDPDTDIVSEIGGSLGAGGNKWSHGVVVGQYIYGIPYDSTTILKIDTSDDSVSTFGSLSGSAKHYWGILDGVKIYCAPYTATTVLVIDTSDDSTSTIGSISGSTKYRVMRAAPNGKMYAVPYNGSSVLEIDPTAGTVAEIGSFSNSNQYLGMDVADNGSLYAFPFDTTVTGVLKFAGIDAEASLQVQYHSGLNAVPMDEDQSSQSLSSSSSSMSASSQSSVSSQSSSSDSSQSSSSVSSSSSPSSLSSISTSSASSESSSVSSESSSSISGSSSSSSSTVAQALGWNVFLPSFAGFTQPLVDIAAWQSPYYPTSGGTGVVNAATGDHVSGEVKHTIWVREGVNMEAGTYNITWDGTGTGPSTMVVSSGDQSKTLTFNGQINNLSIKKSGASGTYTSTFIDRCGRGDCLRWMEAWRTNEDGGNLSIYDDDNPWVRQRILTNTFWHKLLTPTIIAQLCEYFATNMWICIHHRMSNSVISATIQEIVDAGFTGQLYVEHSNEVWNSSFPQFNYAGSQSGGYPGGDTFNIQSWHADRTHEIGGLVKAIVPGAKIVWGSQSVLTAFGGVPLDNAMSDLSNIDAIAIAPYVGGPLAKAEQYNNLKLMSNQQIVDDIGRADWDDHVKSDILAWKAHATARSWDLYAYEFGFHWDNNDSAAEELLSDAANSAEGAVFMGEILDWWNTNVGGLAMIFQENGPEKEPWTHQYGELGTMYPRGVEVTNRMRPARV